MMLRADNLHIGIGMYCLNQIIIKDIWSMMFLSLFLIPSQSYVHFVLGKGRDFMMGMGRILDFVLHSICNICFMNQSQHLCLSCT
jgi:hypothetical protein